MRDCVERVNCRLEQREREGIKAGGHGEQRPCWIGSSLGGTVVAVWSHSEARRCGRAGGLQHELPPEEEAIG
jgi:hypothetical protein